MKCNKYIYISFLFFFGLFSAHTVSALDPLFEARDALLVKDTSAYLQAEFDSQNSDYTSQNMPEVWFQYGEDENSLFMETPPRKKTKGNYLVSEILVDLSPETNYYFRALIDFDGNINYSSIRSFKTESLKNSEYQDSFLGFENSIESQKSLLSEYDSIVNSKKKVFLDRKKTSSSSSDDSLVRPNSETLSSQKKGFSWSDLWPWGKDKKDTDSSYDPDANLVQTEKEVMEKQDEIANTPTTEQENYKNSAANNDERGKVLKYNTNYSNKYKKTNNVTTRRSEPTTLNYPALLLIIGMLLVIVVLLHMIFSRKRKIRQTHRARPTGTANDAPVKYNIPVRREISRSQESQNKAFFRKPPQK